MAKYKVKNTNILHNGKLYKEDSVVELNDVQAKRLEDFVDFLPEQKTNSSKSQTSKTAEQKTTSKTSAKSKSKANTKTTVLDDEANSDDKNMNKGESDGK